MAPPIQSDSRSTRWVDRQQRGDPGLGRPERGEVDPGSHLADGEVRDDVVELAAVRRVGGEGFGQRCGEPAQGSGVLGCQPEDLLAEPRGPGEHEIEGRGGGGDGRDPAAYLVVDRGGRDEREECGDVGGHPELRGGIEAPTATSASTASAAGTSSSSAASVGTARRLPPYSPRKPSLTWRNFDRTVTVSHVYVGNRHPTSPRRPAAGDRPERPAHGPRRGGTWAGRSDRNRPATDVGTAVPRLVVDAGSDGGRDWDDGRGGLAITMPVIPAPDRARAGPCGSSGRTGGQRAHAATSVATSGSGCFRGRPRGRFRATTTPLMNSSPPQTPHGSRRSRAPARQTCHAPGSPGRAPWPPRRRPGTRRRTARDRPAGRAARRACAEPGDSGDEQSLVYDHLGQCLMDVGPSRGSDWPGNTKAVNPGCLGFTAWRLSVSGYTGGLQGWSRTGGELW